MADGPAVRAAAEALESDGSVGCAMCQYAHSDLRSGQWRDAARAALAAVATDPDVHEAVARRLCFSLCGHDTPHLCRDEADAVLRVLNREADRD